MLTQLTDPDLQFLSRFGKSPEFAPLQSLFSRELSSQDEKCRALDGPALYRAQGVAAWLVDLAKAVKGADEELQRRLETRRRQASRAASGRAE